MLLSYFSTGNISKMKCHIKQKPKSADPMRARANPPGGGVSDRNNRLSKCKTFTANLPFRDLNIY